jgi:aspartate racemase
MTQDFYRQKLVSRGIEVVIPGEADVELVNDVIFRELCVGILREESRRTYASIIEKLRAEGAEAVILGCTEIGLLISQEDSVLPVYDTTVIHAKKAVELALAE